MIVEEFDRLNFPLNVAHAHQAWIGICLTTHLYISSGEEYISESQIIIFFQILAGKFASCIALARRTCKQATKAAYNDMSAVVHYYKHSASDPTVTKILLSGCVLTQFITFWTF